MTEYSVFCVFICTNEIVVSSKGDVLITYILVAVRLMNHHAHHFYGPVHCKSGVHCKGAGG